ncbi:MAG: hypothetical protein ACREX0_11395 [Noviherbaspirillum sp.]
MQPKLMYRDESAWAKGDLAYDLDDTIQIGVIKAANAGIRPGGDGYAAFMTAFSRRVRSRQLSPYKAPANRGEVAQAEPAIVLTPDFAHAGT